MKSHLGSSDAARLIGLMSVVLGLVLFGDAVFGAQPPKPAPAPKAGQRRKPAPAPKASQPPKPAPAAKEQYIVDRVDEEQKKNRTQVTIKILKAPNFGPGDQDVLDTYYNTYILPRWSVPENAASLAAWRTDLGNNLKSAKSGLVHDHLIGLVLKYMTKVATENYHPAARFNAILMIGELNAVEAATTTEPPRPLPAALPILVKAVEDAQQLDEVKVGALVGIHRHAELGAITTPEDRQAVSDMALALVGSKRPPGRTADGHAWMRQQAAELLGELGAVGPNGVVATTLAGTVADAASPFDTRCSAAEALGKLNYGDAAGLDPSKLAAPLGRLAVDACAAEAKAQAEAEAKAEAEAESGFPPRSQPVFRRPAPVVPGASSGTQPGDESQTPIPPLFRRRLRYRVNAASIGLNGTVDKPGGVASLAKGTAQEKLVTALQTHVQAILDLIEETRTDEADKLKAMMAKITAEADQVRALLSSPPA